MRAPRVVGWATVVVLAYTVEELFVSPLFDLLPDRGAGVYPYLLSVWAWLTSGAVLSVVFVVTAPLIVAVVGHQVKLRLEPPGPQHGIDLMSPTRTQ